MNQVDSNGFSEQRIELAGAGPALFRLVRFWSRRWAAEAISQDPAEQARVQDVLVLDALDAVSARGEISVSDVAKELGIDHSGASRMIAEATAHGYVAREPSPDDARRMSLSITERGSELQTAAHAWQEETFERLVKGWPVDDVTSLAVYLRRLAGELGGTNAANENLRE